MSVDVTELRLLAHDLGAAPGHIGAAVSRIIRKGGHDVERDAKILAPNDTGNLENSIGTDIEGSAGGSEMSFEVGPTASYAADVEYGTAPHIIRPKNVGGVLVFKIGNRTVHARVVHHPGTRAQPYAGPAFDRNVPGIIDALGDSGEDIL